MFEFLQNMLVFAISAAVLVGAVWGLIDALRRSDAAFVQAGKLSRMAWVAILAVSSAVSFISLPWPLGGGGGIFWFLGIAAAVGVILYFVDVRPKLGPGGFGRGSGGSGSGSGGRPTRGTW